MKKFILGILILTAIVIISSLSCNNVTSEPVNVDVKLSWTAVGDDGVLGGPASQYDMRYATDTLSLINSWDSCLQVPNMPVPGATNTKDSVVFNIDLETSIHYYFAIKVADEIPNWSGISNIVDVYLEDKTAPLNITTLQVESIQ